jgi:hypothetical protein
MTYPAQLSALIILGAANVWALAFCFFLWSESKKTNARIDGHNEYLNRQREIVNRIARDVRR